MLAKLVEKADGTLPFPLVLGDATHMPFVDRAFDAAYLRWVLHLIPDWRGALVEMARVVRPGGVLLVCLGAFDELSTEVRGPVHRDHRHHDRSRRPDLGRPRGRSTSELESAGGAPSRPARRSPRRRRRRSATFLDAIEEGRWSWTWHVPDDARRDAVRELRPWVEERFGPLDRVDRTEVETVWRAYDLPGEG